ncbi:uncharacterized protein HD556DRAFT_1438836 [Suillus plorans]|uniref:Uncharacterized protein n=1 Tax=Suillus plorans TaxID=116603 RepID=A0A9P7DQS8_9AGAM|nr:uncharacterized protein HD556DRAFT_1438836 [Suillus plorans]KAG1800838.1 hypothetical protein HD556DRAFT_1438836 [Suillus plorans]
MESLQTAHQHAANAEDYRNQGLLIPASEEHMKAAEAFHACEDKSQDANTKTTLRMLYNEHVKAGKELQRRIAKLREENQDPTLPQKTTPRHTQVHTHKNGGGSSASPHAPAPASSAPLHASASSSSRLLDSHNNVDESFMVLGQQSDPGDAFNNFWRIMEGMLDNLSQPVAFATAPLGTEPTPAGKKNSRRDGNSSSDTDIEQPHTSTFFTRLGLDGKFKSKVDTLLEETDEEVFADEGNDLSESFCMIPSDSERSRSDLKKENVSLKQELEAMSKRLAAAERIMQLRKEQDQQLRESIVMARHQAQRAMGTSTVITRQSGQQPVVDLSALNINLPAVPAPVTALNVGRDREAQLLSRIRELEEDVRVVRMENEKQKMTIARFRERWEKLKESSRRKKDAKAVEATKTGMGEPIVEEPEAEQMLDEASARPPT